MASSGTIYGSFSKYPSDKVRPYIKWSITNQSITGNYSDVKAELWFVKYDANYWGYNLTGNATGNIKIDTTKSNANITFDTRGDTPKYVKVREWTHRVYHNNDGTKSCWIGADGDTGADVYGTFNFGQTVQLDTIPREAYITNQPDFVVYNGQGTTVHLEFWNDGNLYIKVKLVVNGNVKHEEDLGQVTSADVNLTASENDSILAEFTNSQTTTGTWEVYTYTDSGYSNLVNDKRTKSVTITADEASCKPIFNDFALSNVDKTVNVVDKYGNTLVSSSTSTLLGTGDAIILGYSKVKAVIDSTNFMQAQAHATPNKYVFSDPNQQTEAPHDGNTVTLYLDNVYSNAFNVTAFDSRNFGTVVTKTLTLVEYFNVTIDSIELRRDNDVDQPVKLNVQGKWFNSTFGAQGVQNTLTVEYRWKYSTDSWGSQSWQTLTPTISGNNWSFNDYIAGDKGNNGFDMDKSFDIEVRVYDKLSVVIAGSEINRGTPLIDFTQQGIALQARYDTNEGGQIQLYGKSLMRFGFGGWWKVDVAGFEANFVSDNSVGSYKHYTVDVVDSSIFSIGDKLKIKQNGSWRYFVVTGIKNSTQINIMGVISDYYELGGYTYYTLDNAPIEEVYLSKDLNPEGFYANVQGVGVYGLGEGITFGAGHNLWMNSTMEQYRFAWWSDYWDAIARETYYRRIKISKPDDRAVGLAAQTIYTRLHGDPGFVEGNVYTASGEIFKSSGDGAIQVYVQTKDSNGNWSNLTGVKTVWNSGETVTGRRRFVLHFVLPDNVAQGEVKFYLPDDGKTATFYLTSLQINRGLYPMIWTPRPFVDAMYYEQVMSQHLANDSVVYVNASTRSWISPRVFGIQFKAQITSTGASSDKSIVWVVTYQNGAMFWKHSLFATPHWGYEGGYEPMIFSENQYWKIQGHKGGNSDAWANVYITAFRYYV